MTKPVTMAIPMFVPIVAAPISLIVIMCIRRWSVGTEPKKLRPVSAIAVAWSHPDPAGIEPSWSSAVVMNPHLVLGVKT